jgi:transposase, IS5 family
MAIDMSGQDMLPKEGFVSIEVSQSHPLLMKSVVKDLKETNGKGFWGMGRKIKVRIHLGAYLLQRLYNLTDRKVDYQLKDNASFQLFCGLGIVEDWHAPDHTKIEEFRNRLSPETHRRLANIMAQTAVSLGFADPREVDFDSTVQEANISYPSDASLLTKLAGLGKKLVDFVKEKLPRHLSKGLEVNMKDVKEKVRNYFFLPKNKSIEIKREVFQRLHKFVKHEIRPVVDLCEMLTQS